jgi:hypothetical protein
MAVPWLPCLPSTTVIKGSLAPEEAHDILRIVSRKRWEVMSTAIASHDFKFMLKVALARVDYVGGYSGTHGVATVVCSDRAGSDLVWRFNLCRQGTDSWKVLSLVQAPRLPSEQGLMTAKRG